ncbi:hypothetical protein BU16DRAFT_295285 [Lophium mytilinum]|uniref:Uncharacterized protein n=1 Tax=Lophium mytilinum TaxID=390894 RepID=A0A6A6R102_9PEZI|nr:hypothetical protein BU16DRAFT_295285 [Lophium mytilinum]
MSVSWCPGVQCGEAWRRAREEPERRCRRAAGPIFISQRQQASPAPAPFRHGKGSPADACFRAWQGVWGRWGASRVVNSQDVGGGHSIHGSNSSYSHIAALSDVEFSRLSHVVASRLYLGWIANRRRPLPRFAVVCGAGGRRE